MIVKLPTRRCCYASSVCHMFCSSAQHGREKKRDILVAESTRESCSPIQPFILILCLDYLKLLTKPRAAISSEIRSYTFLLRRITSKLALYFDISSNVNNGGDFVVRPIYVYWFFVCFAVVGIDASAAEAILSSSELVTRLRSRLSIPGCIAPGSVTVVAYRFERFRVQCVHGEKSRRASKSLSVVIDYNR